MVDVWSEGAAFGELRSLVSKRPGADAFARICALIDEAEAAAPGLYASRWREYLASHLASWQPRQCAVKIEQSEQGAAAASAPWADLVKGVDLVRFDLSRAADVDWVASELREAFPLLEHLGLVEAVVRKSAIASACELGVFDELRSLSFDDCGLHLSTLTVLLERLEAREEVEHLRFAHCSMGVPQLERICATTLAPRLRSLGLPVHAKFRADQAKVLASRAPEFVALERLGLSNCMVAGAGAKALAEASWGDSFKHLNLNRNGIRGMGVKALAERGLLGSIVEEGGERTLDLMGQQIGNKALQIVVDSGVLEGVEHLNLWDCNLTTLESLSAAEGLEKVRSLNLYGSHWADREDGTALLEAISRMENLERLTVARRGLSEDFVERLCANTGARHLTSLEFDHYATCSPRDLEAVLGWSRFSELEHLVMELVLPDGDELIARAVETGRFHGRHRSHRGDVVLSADAFDFYPE